MYFIILFIIGILLAKVSMSNPNQICLISEPGDSYYFGISVAINDRYLVVGDPVANRVIIYNTGILGLWIRTEIISPPKDSVSWRVGRGFGRYIQLDENILVIEAFTQELIPNETTVRNFYRRYLVDLSIKTKVKPIDLLIKKETDTIQLNLLYKGNIKKVILCSDEKENFGKDISLSNNLLLVGFTPSYERKTNGGAYLYNISLEPPAKILELEVSDALLGGSVAVSEQFAVVGNPKSGVFLRDGRYTKRKTLIRNINNNSTKVIDGTGKLSLSGNILARMHYSISCDPLQEVSLLEVFYLDDNTEPHLFIRRENLLRAWVQNDVLISVRDSYDSGIEICLEPVN